MSWFRPVGRTRDSHTSGPHNRSIGPLNRQTKVARACSTHHPHPCHSMVLVISPSALRTRSPCIMLDVAPTRAVSCSSALTTLWCPRVTQHAQAWESTHTCTHASCGISHAISCSSPMPSSWHPWDHPACTGRDCMSAFAGVLKEFASTSRLALAATLSTL